ncbi:MAG: hypothetical protein A2Z99_08810 [Treponema sp. GWB1_62_6]|nr:MAG: hypothetical protein A2Y36_14140 [Treponema sp. GWA1_62_8]OHE65935.1 MAG: hypothetical protein A2001_15875 [Treponema sp. GWC1_61_84]OHE69763.1 MAG: hypothetical protein A2Z99_08810 [Treponema sp. GWB1_62_6]OHE73669.1 MAG: hypothetical protein A2413_10560 [Treponema sp. RIFOXYC1_FULL_61_9]HCM28224.1 hypothetical protein [Treponema sp.]
MKEWTAAEAKANFSRLMDEASRSPQVVSKHGRPSCVMIDFESYRKNEGRLTDVMGRLLEEIRTINQLEDDFEPPPRIDRPIDFPD